MVPGEGDEETDEEEDLFGTDLVLTSKKDEITEIVTTDLSILRTGDLDTVAGRDNVVQAIRNRLATRKGELAELGHPEYGSLLEEMIGEPNTEDTRRIIETLVHDCLKYEPRIESILSVTATSDDHTRDRVEVTVQVRLRKTMEVVSVTYPLYLEGTQ